MSERTQPKRVCTVCNNHSINPDRYACPHCVQTLRNLLTDLPEKMLALDAAVTRQLRFTPQFRNGGRSANHPLPVNLTASENAYIAHETLLRWTDQLARDRNVPTPTTWGAVGSFLRAITDNLTTTTEGAEAIDEITHALRVVNRTIDAPRYRRIPVHVPCVDHTINPAGDRVPCPGEYYVLLDNDAPWTKAIPDMTCTEDNTHTITPAEWQAALRHSRSDPVEAHAYLATRRGLATA